VSELRVLIDASNCKPGQGGIRTYVTSLVDALSQRDDLSVTVATSVPEAFQGTATLIEVDPATRTFERRLVWRERSLPRMCEREGADVLLVPVPEPLWRSVSCPVVTVLHDVGPLVLPRLYGRNRWLRYRLALPHLAARSTAVVCVSEATRRGLVEAVPGIAARVAVIGEAPQPLPRAGSPEQNDLLYVGSLMPHKNVDVILRAIAALGRPVDLRIVGPCTASERQQLEGRATQLGISESVRFEGFVGADRLANLYAGTAAVVLPTLYEGFGLTAVEALAAGAPLIASDLAVLREACSDRPTYIASPTDERAWAAAIDAKLESRRAPASAGASLWASSQTWQGVAAEFVQLFGSVCAERAVAA
jgi:glycosyltransferase involved in cell wall biosynthesis